MRYRDTSSSDIGGLYRPSRKIKRGAAPTTKIVVQSFQAESAVERAGIHASSSPRNVHLVQESSS